jgi:hypothetical protein
MQTIAEAGWFSKCKQKCDGSPTFVKYGWAPDPADATKTIYFRVKKCKCTAGHDLGEYRHDTQNSEYANNGLELITYTSYGTNPPAVHPSPHDTECQA